ncbi:MAG: hypothetical protein AAGA85_26365, partial [Bacteroidota bacterium]
MDEITLVNLLNKICEKNPLVTWNLTCRYQEEFDQAIMETKLFERESNECRGFIIFTMETGSVIRGTYLGLFSFKRSTAMTDALLEILHYE